MIVYQETKSEFITDVRNDTIAENVEALCLEKLGRKTPRSEFNSWRNSMSFMRDAMDDTDIPSDTGISIGLQPPGSSTRLALDTRESIELGTRARLRHTRLRQCNPEVYSLSCVKEY